MVNLIKGAGEDYEFLATVFEALKEGTLTPDGKKYNIDSFDRKGKTALHSAINLGNKEVIKAILKLGADVNKKINDPTDSSQNGMTALHLAIEKRRLDIVKLLVEEVVDTIDLDIQDERGNTAFHIAMEEGIKHNDTSFVLYLKSQKNIDLNLQNKARDTPGHFLGRALHSYAAAVEYTKGFDFDIPNNKFQLPFSSTL